MKTYVLYGFISALAGAFLILILFFLGYHSDAAKLGAASWIQGIIGLGIGITCTTLGVKARRAEVPAAQEFGYGQALGAGVLISLVASFLNSIFAYAYNAFINPGFADVMLQHQRQGLEAKGISSNQIDKMESMSRVMMSPAIQAVVGLVAGFIIGFIISLIVAAFLKRPAPAAAGA